MSKSKSNEPPLLQQLAAFPEHNPSPILLLTSDGEVIYANPATEILLKQLGLSDRDYDAILPAGFRDDLNELQNSDLKHISHDYKLNNRILSCAINQIHELSTNFYHVYITDITEQRKSTKIIERLAYYDPITHLPNRVSLVHEMKAILNLAKESNSKFSFLIFDLDHFKDINYTLGHYYGDLMLKETAKRLQENIWQGYFLARFGEDEFGLLMPDTTTQDACRQAEEIIMALEEPLTLSNLLIDAEGSIGIVTYPAHGTSIDVLIQRSDVAMHLAHTSNKEIVVYDSAHDNYNTRSLTLMTDLRHAIRNDELYLVFQPKIDIRTKRVTGTEALVRWEHPAYGLIPPDEFIPTTERTRMIGDLTKWVLNKALQHCAEFHRAGFRFSIAVNISTQDLHDNHFPNMVYEFLASWEIDPSWLILEITENALIADTDRSLRNITRLHEIGVSIAIDDFGTGYSSLAYLKQLSVDELKIDKSFVIDMLSDENSRYIVRSTINLAHNLNLRITAEGVEDKDSLLYLDGLGCDVAQGYYIAKPLTPAALVSWLPDCGWRIDRKV